MLLSNEAITTHLLTALPTKMEREDELCKRWLLCQTNHCGCVWDGAAPMRPGTWTRERDNPCFHFAYLRLAGKEIAGRRSLGSNQQPPLTGFSVHRDGYLLGQRKCTERCRADFLDR